jgi:hypothetical protein
MVRRVLVLIAFLGATGLPAGAQEVRFVYDARPEADIPREARWAGTRPGPPSPGAPASNISFRIATDLKDYGPPRSIIGGDLHAVTVRYYDGSFKDLEEVRTYLTSVLRAEKGSTTTYCPWAEALPVPGIEATIQFTSGKTGKVLVWRQGRLVYRDPDMKWWFAYGW